MRQGPFLCPGSVAVAAKFTTAIELNLRETNPRFEVIAKGVKDECDGRPSEIYECPSSNKVS